MSAEKTAETTIFSRRESEVRSYCRTFDTVFETAKGSYLIDRRGRRYIDFLAGCSTLNYGHNDPDMQKALLDHIMADGLAHGLDLHSTAKAAFLEAFERIILRPRGMDYKLMMTGPTGTNAVEAAMKLARKVTGRETIIAFTNGFHGMTLGALAATGSAGKRASSGMTLHGIQRMPYEGAFGPKVDTLSQIEAMLDNPSSGIDAPAAFLVETVQGEGGLNAASREWMRAIARIARKNGALLIVDDIQAGIGRTGPFFSFEEMGITPDLVPLAKSLSGMGLPFAALLLRPELDIWKPAEHNGTFRGNTHAFVTARVALEKFWQDDSFQREVKARGEHLGQRLDDIARSMGLDDGALKGRGMMRGIDVGSGELAGAICAECFRNGLIIETSGAYDEVVKVLAPLTTPNAVLDEGLDILAAAVIDCTATETIAAE